MADDFTERFLNKNSLRTLFVYLCKSNSESPDPITDALATMLTCPVQYTISKHGLVMFKGSPAIPFTHMNPGQRQLLYDVVSSIRCEVHTYGPFALNENPLTYQVENERISVNIPTQKLDPKLVIQIVLELIAESKKPSTLLFNLLIQRLGSKVNITKDTLTFVNQRSKELLHPQNSTQRHHADEK